MKEFACRTMLTILAFQSLQCLQTAHLALAIGLGEYLRFRNDGLRIIKPRDP